MFPGYLLQIVAFFEAVIYAAISLISLLIATSYFKAYQKEKPTWIIQSVIVLFACLFFSYFLFFLTAMAFFLEGASFKYTVLVNFLSIANLPLLIAILNFWYASTSNQGNKRRIRRKID